MKGDGGTRGLHRQQEEKEIIELTKPDVLRVIEEFETVSISRTESGNRFEHQEASIAEQKSSCLTLDHYLT